MLEARPPAGLAAAFCVSMLDRLIDRSKADYTSWMLRSARASIIVACSVDGADTAVNVDALEGVSEDVAVRLKQAWSEYNAAALGEWPQPRLGRGAETGEEVMLEPLIRNLLARCRCRSATGCRCSQPSVHAMWAEEASLVLLAIDHHLRKADSRFRLHQRGCFARGALNHIVIECVVSFMEEGARDGGERVQCDLDQVLSILRRSGILDEHAGGSTSASTAVGDGTESRGDTDSEPDTDERLCLDTGDVGVAYATGSAMQIRATSTGSDDRPSFARLSDQRCATIISLKGIAVVLALTCA